MICLFRLLFNDQDHEKMMLLCGVFVLFHDVDNVGNAFAHAVRKP